MGPKLRMESIEKHIYIDVCNFLAHIFPLSFILKKYRLSLHCMLNGWGSKAPATLGSRG
jgi:hypothetical protein